MILYFLLLVLLPFVKSTLLPLELSALCSLPTTLTGFPASWDCVNTNLTTQCTWPGVKCTTNGERVLEIDLSGFTLTGTLPADVWSLEAILSFILRGSTGVSGSIPTQIGNAATMQTLVLSNLNLNGAIPMSIGNIVALTSLDLSGNRLTGILPSDILQCTYLSSIDISRNRISGVLPDLSPLPVNRLNIISTEINGCFPQGLQDTLTSCNASSSSFYCECPSPSFCGSQLCCDLVANLDSAGLTCVNGVYQSLNGTSTARLQTLNINIPAKKTSLINSNMFVGTSFQVVSGSLSLRGNVAMGLRATFVLQVGNNLNISGGCINITDTFLNVNVGAAPVLNGSEWILINSNCIIGDFNKSQILDTQCYSMNYSIVPNLGVVAVFSTKSCASGLSAEAVVAIIFFIIIFIGLAIFGVYFFLNKDLQEHVFQNLDEKESMILDNKFMPKSGNTEFV